jgi:hypothetical protein
VDKIFLVTVFFLLTVLTSLANLHPSQAQNVLIPTTAVQQNEADIILNTFLRNFSRMNPETRGHFALRMYRVTGDESYIGPVRSYAEITAEKLSFHAQNLGTPGHAEAMTEDLLKPGRKKNSKSSKRTEALKNQGTTVFARRLLFLAYELKCFGLHDGPYLGDFERVIRYLKSVPFENFLMDENVIRYNASRATSAVYYLKYLGIGDHEVAYARRFREIFMGIPDESLNEIEYLNKIYGMTHFIIAGSGFYQNHVDRKKYAWILDYFADNFETITARLKLDVIAEVGLSFKLAKQKNHIAVAMSKDRILTHFERKHGLVIVPGLSRNLDKMEHRNIVSYLLLVDFDKLYPGPDL